MSEKLFKFKSLRTHIDQIRFIRILNTFTIYCPKISELNDFHEAYNFYDLGRESRLDDLHKNILSDSSERAYTRVLSLTPESNLKNPVMWSIYAGEGCGVAFSITVIESENVKNEKVIYDSNLFPKSTTEKSIRVKDSRWEFESETRYIFKPGTKLVKNRENEGALFEFVNSKYKKIKIDEIYLGLKIDRKLKRRIFNIAKRKEILIKEISPFSAPKINFRNVT